MHHMKNNETIDIDSPQENKGQGDDNSSTIPNGSDSSTSQEVSILTANSKQADSNRENTEQKTNEVSAPDHQKESKSTNTNEPLFPPALTRARTDSVSGLILADIKKASIGIKKIAINMIAKVKNWSKKRIFFTIVVVLFLLFGKINFFFSQDNVNKQELEVARVFLEDIKNQNYSKQAYGVEFLDSISASLEGVDINSLKATSYKQKFYSIWNFGSTVNYIILAKEDNKSGYRIQFYYDGNTPQVIHIMHLITR